MRLSSIVLSVSTPISALSASNGTPRSASTRALARLQRLEDEPHLTALTSGLMRSNQLTG